MARVIDTGVFDVVQTSFNYSLLWREAENSIFPVAKKHNMGIICSSPLQQGSLAVRRDDIIEHGAPWISKPRKDQFRALYKFLDETGMGIVEMAMRFIISNPDVNCVLTGSKSSDEFEENWTSVEKGPLPSDMLKRLDEIYQMVPFRPTLEPILLPWGDEWPELGWIR
jgi:D-threo-aldose 1-dehydrogenase